MILVISSPSNSTTGFLTLIFLNPVLVAIFLFCIPNPAACSLFEAAREACCEKVEREMKEVEEGEARKQRKAVVLFILRKRKGKYRKIWNTIRPEPVRIEGSVHGTPLTVVRQVVCAGLYLSELMFARRIVKSAPRVWGE
jgi:hypothetical protein